MDKSDRKTFCDSIMAMSDAAWGATSGFLRQHGFPVPLKEPDPPPKVKKVKETLTPEESEQLTVMERLSGVRKGK